MWGPLGQKRTKIIHILMGDVLKGFGALFVRLYKDADHAGAPTNECSPFKLHMTLNGLFHKHFSMESVPDLHSPKFISIGVGIPS